jgi:hypothetical protein
MTREEKIKLAIEKGYTCDPETGKVYGIKGNEIIGISRGYSRINILDDKKIIGILGHQFIWYWVYGTIVDCIDHINGDKVDNRISNLRSITQQENTWNNRLSKGYSYHKTKEKWRAYIVYDYKQYHLGYFQTKEEAKEAYLEAKRKHHLISGASIF